VVFKAGANDLAFVGEELRADKPHDAVYKEWIEASRVLLGLCRLVVG
jgi:hypothetical protein